jgi:cytoplasmic iron level regulating protein YaaA (DUF328/UPF0246 family)
VTVRREGVAARASMSPVARPRPLILLPPSEGKAPGGDGPPWAADTMAVGLDDRRRSVMAALVRAMRWSETRRRDLLGVKGAALASATEADRVVADSPTMAAIDRYTGVLYDALDHTSLPAAARRRMDDTVLVLSGLWGVVAPSDPIPDYKLKMGASLPRLGRLSTWWRPALSDQVAARADRRRVWNLLPLEHAAALAGPLGVEEVSVAFLEPGRGGGLVAVSHWNKLLKGALVRHLLEHPSTGPDDLADWEHPLGFRLDPGLTEAEGPRIRVHLVRR